MDYDKLVGRLRWEADNKGLPPFDGWKWLHEAADAIDRLQSDLAAARARVAELENERAEFAVKFSPLEWVRRAERAEAELAAARALLREARGWTWTNDDSPDDLFTLNARIDAAIAGERKE